MNPFDAPPATPPVSFDPPPPGGDEPPSRRGRMALVALAAAGLVGGGLVGVSHLVSADRPSVVDDAALTAVDAPDDDIDDIDDTDDADDGEADERVTIDGEVVIDIGDGEPVVIDLGEAGAALEEFNECMGLPELGGRIFDLEVGEGPFGTWEPGEWDGSELEEWLGELPLGELPHFDDFGVVGLDGTLVTVAGPDGVSVIDLGEGDGSVTITKRGDEVTITTDGDATVDELPGWFEAGPLDLEAVDPSELEELFGEDFDPDAMLEEFFGEDFDPESMLQELFGDDFDLEPMLDEFLGGEIELGELPLLEMPEQLDECLAILQDG